MRNEWGSEGERRGVSPPVLPYTGGLTPRRSPIQRILVSAILALGLLLYAGCSRNPAEPELVWGKHGVRDGELARPRAIAIEGDDLVIVDFTARIQHYDLDGNFQKGHCWTTPAYNNGRPSGLSFDQDHNIIVSDSHYHIFHIYALDGTLIKTIGQPGDFVYIGDVVQDKDRNYYVAESENQTHRITKVDSQGNIVKRWGSVGQQPGQLARPRAMTIGPDNNLYVADACNHRIQVFTLDGELVRCWGEPGTEPGQLSYPYDLGFAADGNLYVVEYDNHRVQKFTADGQSLGVWGGPGREPGKLHNPWALAVDKKGRVHVVDTENHRVQRIRF